MYNISFPKLGLEFNINPIAFSFWGITVYWYGIILACGFITALIYTMKNCDRFSINKDKFLDCVIVGIITGLIGARLFYVFFFPGDKYIKNPISILYINEGGIAIYGGIIGGLLGGILVAKIKKLNIKRALDLACLGFLIGQAIGRWGNFTNQEAFGGPTNSIFGMVSQNTMLESSLPVHPCFLYESFWCILGFILLDIFTRKCKYFDGQIFLMYIVWYGFERFFIEALRTDSLIIPILGLKVSQVIAALSIVIGVTLIIVFKCRYKKQGVKIKNV